MKSNLRKVIFFIILLGIGYVGHAYMIKPSNSSLAELKGQVQNKVRKLEELEKAAVAARDLGRQLEQLQEAIGFFESKLPPQSQIHKVLEQVTVIAQRQGLTTRSIRTLKQKDCKGYVEQPLKMELHGNFNSYYSFLLELERLPRITKIRELELKKDHRNEGEATAKFTVSIFFRNATS